MLLLDEPSASLDPRQRERLWQFIEGLVERGTAVVFSTHDVGEAERYAGTVLVLVDGELLFAGTPDRADRAPSAETRATSRPRSCASCTSAATRRRTILRWLFVKDLQILRRSPLLVGLLIVYPVVIALMIGFALSSPPGKPKVAYFSEVPPGKGSIQLRHSEAQRLELREPAVPVDPADQGALAR